MTERSEMEAALEAILFVSSEPVPRSRLLDLFPEEEREEATAALEAVLARYSPDGIVGMAASPDPPADTADAVDTDAADAADAADATETAPLPGTADMAAFPGIPNPGAVVGRGIMAEEVAGGVRLVTRPEMVSYLRRFFDVAGGSKLSMAALETLAIVAYRQPITGPEIQELRSVSPVGVVKTLLERRLVRIVGRKEVVGKPFLYGTTREFLVHFGLNSLKDLPPLEEFEETFGNLIEGGAEGGGGDPGIGREERADREEEILREAAALEEAAANAPEPPEPPEPESPAEAEADLAADPALADEVEV
ncbi:MAG TPA: SMC-Scp complex subunit ScpB [Thermoanaerobaculia bacterium]|nr:SMC-Scp complex subunit ScpB [Thermoanaerobaculia bacterium]